MSINPQINAFLNLPDDQRRNVYRIAAEKMSTLPEYIEKDLWTCHVLDVLFNTDAPDRPRLLFRGGTSLSKVYIGCCSLTSYHMHNYSIAGAG